MRLLRHGAAAVVVAAAILAGCKKQEAPPPPVQAPAAAALGALTLGSALGADKAVVAAKDVFGVRDTIYVSIATTGIGQNVKLKAVWTFGNETVRADSQMLNLDGPATTEFHILRPRAWPTGSYQVSVTLNDGAPQTKDFSVR